MKKKTTLIVIFFICFLFLFFTIDYHLSEKYFCAYCDFDDKNIIYKLFFFNDSNSGYNSYPTIINLLTIGLLSLIFSYLIVKYFCK